jgi:branched-chain amino acid transport system permease protein
MMIGIWTSATLIAVAAPLVFDSGFALSLLLQMGSMIVLCLSYNMMFGQAGMLSFGHAAHSGLGAYFAIHAMNMASEGTMWIPVSLIPLVGGLAGAGFGMLLGYVITRKSGTTFAMITLGIGELVFASSLMFPGFFGGEGGIMADRVYGQPFLGISFASTREVYYLVATWCVLCAGAMYAFTQTPLGRISNAVRDNSERAEFVGYNTRIVRYIVLIISGFFAGISGGLSAITFEMASAEELSIAVSGAILFATVIGGAGTFAGPIFGAIIFVLITGALSELTRAWQLYLGVFFVVLIMYAPGGMATLAAINLRAQWKSVVLARAYWTFIALVLLGMIALLSFVMLVEMMYFHTGNVIRETVWEVGGLALDTSSSTVWIILVSLLAASITLFRIVRRHSIRRFDTVHAQRAAIEDTGVSA